MFPGSSEYLHYYGSIDVYSANLADFAVCLLISKHKERNLWYIAPFPFYNINTNASLISLYCIPTVGDKTHTMEASSLESDRFSDTSETNSSE